MIKDPIFDNYKRVLSQQRLVLETLFLSSLAAIEESSNRPRLGDWSEDIVEAFHESAVNAYAQQIYAGCLFLILDRWIRSLATDLGLQKEDRLDAGELVGKTPLSRLVWATANNFRHYKEWKQKPRDSELSVQALNAAGLYGDILDDIYAADVLRIISPLNYDDLEQKILKIATELRAKIQQ